MFSAQYKGVEWGILSIIYNGTLCGAWSVSNRLDCLCCTYIVAIDV